MSEKVLTTYFPIIQRQYPHIKKEDLILLPGGYAHTVILANNRAFRFPQTKEFAVMHHAENEFSKRFTALSSLSIPLMVGHIDEPTGIAYQTYEFIPGVPFTQKIAMSLTEDELLAIATEIGQFLRRLHAYPITELEGLSNHFVKSAEEYARYFKNIFSEDKKVIGSLLTDVEWLWVEKNISNYYELVKKHPFPLKMIHGDMLPKHILIDNKMHRLTGVIDFLLKIGDPANDFRYFDRYGNLFLKKVYEQYHQVDEFFEERRKFHARDFPVAQVYMAIKSKNVLFQEQYLTELKEYIATHPL